MRKLTATLCLTLAVLLGSVGCQTTDLPYLSKPKPPSTQFPGGVKYFQLGQSSEARGDYVKASDYYLRAAEQGHPSGRFRAEWILSIKESMETTSTKPKPPSTQFPGGVEYFQLGQSSEARGDYVKASDYYLRAAEQGHPSGRFRAEWVLSIKESMETTSTVPAETQANVIKNYKKYTDITPTVTARKSSPPSKSAAELENERLRRENARLKNQNQSKPKQVAKKSPPKKASQPKVGSTGSGFFVSKLGHIITNEHVSASAVQ